MKIIQRILVCAILLLCFNAIKAQDTTTSLKIKKNMLKVNLTALPLNNYSLQYERILKKSLSVAIAFRVMPNHGIPFKNEILDAIDEGDQDTRDVIEKFRMSNFAITPELRWYVGKKGYGRGFYIAPFYRFASFKANELVFDYENQLGQPSGSVSLAGKLTAHTGGILFGMQYLLGKSICLDISILGPHIGGGSGTLTGNSTQAMTPSEQNDLRQELEDLDIPLTRKTITVNANSATMKLDGPWGGVRSGISLGIRF